MQERRNKKESNRRYTVSRLEYVAVAVLLIFVAACASYTTYTALNIAYNKYVPHNFN